VTPLAIWSFVRRWLLVLLAGVVLAAAASYVVSARLPKVYASTARLIVAPTTANTGSADYTTVQAAQNLTRTYTELAKSRPVVQGAIDAGQLGITYDQAVLLLDVSPVRDTQLLEITARGSDPEKPAALANQVSAALIQQTRDATEGRLADSQQTLASQLDKLTQDIADDTNQIASLQAQARSPDVDSQIARVNFELTHAQQSYASTQRSYEDLQVAQARATDVLSVADPAIASDAPIQPRILVNVVVAAILGLVLAASVAIVIELADDRVNSPARVARYTGLPVLGSVRPPSHRRAAEPFRSIGTTLAIASPERPVRTLLVTSTCKGEGKTTVAANLAIVLAQSGKKVIAVDADLRVPRLHEVFGLQHADSGLVQTRVEGLRILPSGRIPANPSEVVASPDTRGTLSTLARDADLVLIDAPAVLANSDAIVLARLVDAVLLVVNTRGTRGQHLSEATDQLERARARLLGVVLNQVPEPPLPLHRAQEIVFEPNVRPTVG
jgi:capsular exopolysaccharide synthesis family protein